MNCPKCNGLEYRKNGFVRGKQRYFCKVCDYHYSVSQRVGTGSVEVKQLALSLYLEGNGFRGIGRLLGFSNVTILRWIRDCGKDLAEIKSEEPIETMELDELHTYVSQKNYCWIWIAVDRNKKRFVDCVLGSRDAETGQKLWDSVGHLATGK